MKNEEINNLISKLLNNEDKIFSGIDQLGDKIKLQIEKGNRIIFIGIGMSSTIAETAMSQIHRYRVDASLVDVFYGIKSYESGMENPGSLEDVHAAAILELDSIGINENDLVIGVTISGKTKYVSSALSYAKTVGCTTAIISPNSTVSIINNTEIDIIVDSNEDENISIDVKYVNGATTLKIILDLLLINSMTKMGRIWKGIIVNTKLSSNKLVASLVKWLMEEYDLSLDNSLEIISEFNKSLPHIILNVELGMKKSDIEFELKTHNYNVKKIIENHS